MKQKTERINLLVQELQTAKTCREQTLKERDDLKVMLSYCVLLEFKLLENIAVNVSKIMTCAFQAVL